MKPNTEQPKRRLDDVLPVLVEHLQKTDRRGAYVGQEEVRSVVSTFMDYYYTTAIDMAAFLEIDNTSFTAWLRGQLGLRPDLIRALLQWLDKIRCDSDACVADYTRQDVLGPEHAATDFGHELRKRRLGGRISVEMLARKVGVRPNTVTRIELERIGLWPERMKKLIDGVAEIEYERKAWSRKVWEPILRKYVGEV